MSYTPFVRWRNFNLENLKSMLELYPDLLTTMRRETVADQIEMKLKGYKRTAYQFGCQLGMESRAEYFTKQNYLYFLDDTGLEKYLGFWFKMYVCPNPYVNSMDAPISPFREIAEQVLIRPNYKISYSEFCDKAFGEGKSIDIFKNALIAWGKPLSVYEDTVSIMPDKVEELKKCLKKVKETLPMKNNKDINEFFERFSCDKFMDFYDLTTIDQYSNGRVPTPISAEVVAEDLQGYLTINQLGAILADMYNTADNKTTAIHMFGIKYGSIIKKNGFTSVGLIAASGINESYHVEVSKGVRIYEAIKANEYGIKFYEEDVEPANSYRLPTLRPRSRTKYPLNCILYGAPGTGKTYATAQFALAIAEDKELTSVSTELRSDIMNRYNKLVEDGQIVFTTFHQSYGYEDFVQGVRPDTSTNKMAFKTVDGVFKVIADKAMGNPDKDYIIIIDEINRANISKVFGELITLIENDKRWGEENAINATLPFGEMFAVPNNLYIVGTMNSADKSISLIDTALRRRFEFIEYVPDLTLVSDPKLRTVLEKLNKGLAEELNSTDLLVGHAYFMNKSEDDLCDIMNHSIIPLLYEYFFDNQKKVEAQIKKAVEGMNVEVKAGSMGRIRIVKKDVE